MPPFVDTLVIARLTGTAVTDPDPTALPATLDAGYAVQDDLHRRLTAAGYGRRCGWKIGCTTPVMQQYLNIDSPCAGGLFTTAVLQSPAEVPFAGYAAPGVECEIAVRLGADLPRTGTAYDRHAVSGAVAQVHAAIEIVDQRLAGWRDLATPVLVADDFFQAGAVVGPPVDFDPGMDLAALTGEMTVNGASVGTGRGGDVLGHPLDALAWLANQRLAQGSALRQGDLVLTGSVVQTHWVAAGDTVTARIAGLGDARVTFTA
jgi:2-keto-4-pentenoate hydratase